MQASRDKLLPKMARKLARELKQAAPSSAVADRKKRFDEARCSDKAEGLYARLLPLLEASPP